MNIYFLRVPYISLAWFFTIAKNEIQAIEKAARKIDSQTVDFFDPSIFEIKYITICEGNDNGGLDESITGHCYHCPNCNKHLTSLFLCPACFTRYDIPETARYI